MKAAAVGEVGVSPGQAAVQGLSPGVLPFQGRREPATKVEEQHTKQEANGRMSDLEAEKASESVSRKETGCSVLQARRGSWLLN